MHWNTVINSRRLFSRFAHREMDFRSLFQQCLRLAGINNPIYFNGLHFLDKFRWQIQWISCRQKQKQFKLWVRWVYFTKSILYSHREQLVSIFETVYNINNLKKHSWRKRIYIIALPKYICVFFQINRLRLCWEFWYQNKRKTVHLILFHSNWKET